MTTINSKQTITNGPTASWSGLGIQTLFLVAAIILTGWAATKLDNRDSLSHSVEAFLYLPKGENLKHLALGNEELLADFYLIQGAVHYGEHHREHQAGKFQFKFLYAIFDLVTDLDPLYKDAFVMGAQLMSDPNKAIKLLEKGVKSFPNDWKLTEMIGFTYYYHLHDKATAATYYDKASKLGGDPPPYVASLAGKFYREVGYYAAAIKVLQKTAEETDREDVATAFKNRAEQLYKMMNLQTAAGIFEERQGRYPVSMQELALFGILERQPDFGKNFTVIFDTVTEKVILHEKPKN